MPTREIIYGPNGRRLTGVQRTCNNRTKNSRKPLAGGEAGGDKKNYRLATRRSRRVSHIKTIVGVIL